MKCPECNAHNPDGAAFCSLCLTKFAKPEPDPPPIASAPEPGGPPPAAPEPLAPPTPGRADLAEAAAALVASESGTAEPQDGAGTGAEAADGTGDDAGSPEPAAPAVPGRGTAQTGRIRRTDEGFDWQCDRCATWSPLEVSTCTVCGRPFRAAVGGESDGPELADVDPRIALGLSMVLPGAGHLALGRTGTGLARLMLFCIWAFGALSFAIQARDSEQSAIAAIPLALGALIMWGISLYDVQNLSAGRDEPLLDGRRMLWLVFGIFGATMAAMLPSLTTVADNTPTIEGLGSGFG